MIAQHTQGRLEVHTHTYAIADTGDYDSLFEIRDSNDRAIAWFGGTDDDEANARRLVACWNACEGVSTDDLEQSKASGLIRSIYAKNAAIAQRDELLAALEALAGLYPSAEEMNDSDDYSVTEIDWVEIARAAIAKVEGGAA